MFAFTFASYDAHLFILGVGSHFPLICSLIRLSRVRDGLVRLRMRVMSTGNFKGGELNGHTLPSGALGPQLTS